MRCLQGVLLDEVGTICTAMIERNCVRRLDPRSTPAPSAAGYSSLRSNARRGMGCRGIRGSSAGLARLRSRSALASGSRRACRESHGLTTLTRHPRQRVRRRSRRTPPPRPTRRRPLHRPTLPRRRIPHPLASHRPKVPRGLCRAQAAPRPEATGPTPPHRVRNARPTRCQPHPTHRRVASRRTRPRRPTRLPRRRPTRLPRRRPRHIRLRRPQTRPRRKLLCFNMIHQRAKSQQPQPSLNPKRLKTPASSMCSLAQRRSDP